MQRPVTTIAFDLSGVLVLPARRVLTAAEARHMWQIFKAEPLYTQVNAGRISLAKASEKLIASGKLKRSELPSSRAFLYSDRAANRELIKLAAQLKRRGYTIAIFSNNPTEILEDWVKRFRLDRTFTHIVHSAALGTVKPRRRFYLAACRQVGAKPAETLFIDDQAENVAGARAAGLQAMSFRSTAATIARLERLL